MCLPHFFCAFDDCYPNPAEHSNIILDEAIRDMESPVKSYLDLDPKLKNWVDYVDNPSYNLPSKVISPKEANNVVAAIMFA